jgi:hypothetical protein
MIAKWQVMGFLVLLLATGCGSKHESTETPADTTFTPLDSLTISQGLTYRDCDAVVVGEGVRLRSAPGVRSEVLDNLHTGVLLKIVGKSEQKESLERYNVCDPEGFHWYEVITSRGSKGWVYGEFVYELLHPGKVAELIPMMSHGLAPKLINRQYMYQEKWFRMGFARAKKTSVQQEEDLPPDTLCVTFLFPYFYHDAEGVVYPWRFVPNRKNDIRMYGLVTDKKFFQLSTDGVYNDMPDSHNMMGDILQLTIARDDHYDDDPFRYTLLVKKEGEHFIVTPADAGKEYLP